MLTRLLRCIDPNQTRHIDCAQSQIRQVILYLLFTQLAESRTYCAIDSFVAQEMVRRFADNADFDGVAVHFAFDCFFEC